MTTNIQILMYYVLVLIYLQNPLERHISKILFFSFFISSKFFNTIKPMF